MEPRPIDQAHFREALGHFATGLVVATGSGEEGPVGFTCQSFASVSLDPPLVQFCPSKASRTWPKLRRAEVIGLSILGEHQEAVARSFSQSGADKFAGVGWALSSRGAPILEGALGWLEVEVVAVHDAGDHEIVLAQVLDLGTNPGTPLVFYRGGYGGYSA